MLTWKLQIGAYEKGSKMVQCGLPKTERLFGIPLKRDCDPRNSTTTFMVLEGYSSILINVGMVYQALSGFV